MDNVKSVVAGWRKLKLDTDMSCSRLIKRWLASEAQKNVENVEGYTVTGVILRDQPTVVFVAKAEIEFIQRAAQYSKAP